VKHLNISSSLCFNFGSFYTEKFILKSTYNLFFGSKFRDISVPNCGTALQTKLQRLSLNVTQQKRVVWALKEN
jgi:hypothetical protein